jgi:AcrR family transcriptional regulator
MGKTMASKRRLDKDAVVQAALELLNDEGASGISLGKLAQRLGVQTPSLYNHITGLPGLQRELALYNARALGERLTETAVGKTGRQALLAMADTYRSYIKEFPGLYQASLRASGNQAEVDEELRSAEERPVRTGLVVMGSLGIQGEDAVHAVRGFRSLVHGFATLEISGGFGLPLDCDESFHRLLTYYVDGLEKSAASP